MTTTFQSFPEILSGTHFPIQRGTLSFDRDTKCVLMFVNTKEPEKYVLYHVGIFRIETTSQKPVGGKNGT